MNRAGSSPASLTIVGDDVLVELVEARRVHPGEQRVVDLPERVLLGRGPGDDRRDAGLVGEVGEVPPLDAQDARVDVLRDELGLGLHRERGAVGAGEVGVLDHDDGRVDGAEGERVAGLASARRRWPRAGSRCRSPSPPSTVDSSGPTVVVTVTVGAALPDADEGRPDGHGERDHPGGAGDGERDDVRVASRVAPGGPVEAVAAAGRSLVAASGWRGLAARSWFLRVVRQGIPQGVCRAGCRCAALRDLA